MRFRKLPIDQFWEEYYLAFEEVDVPTEADKDRLRDRIFSIQEKVDTSLGEKWTKESDYEVGDDYNYCYHVCGGVYSSRTLCADYVRRVVDALSQDEDPSIWTYHTCVEDCLFDGNQFLHS